MSSYFSINQHFSRGAMWSKYDLLFWAVLAFNFAVDDAVVFKFSNFQCKSYNESWFVFNYYRLKAVSRDRVLLNMNGTILHPAHNIQVHAKVYKKANGFKPWLLETTVDMCRFINKRYDPFLKIVYNIFKEFSNINHTCPYVGHQVIKDLYVNPELLILPIPSGEYLLTGRWNFDKKLIIGINVTFIFMEDLLKRT
ncbi:uncharacterized protein LOC108099770 [Drosophila ficusphila]|uniref:uncharacterized protein LOC108099770 n=1 Tax=Drosophila ficusphila TaxID=30025 RepID=UPI0007E71475|nr:uncharacterized protein LOC108099770 [Drosophila ficusphila]